MEKNKGFKMKGSSLYGKLSLNRGGYENMSDGRSKSSPFQTDPKKKDENDVPKKNTKGAPLETEKSTAKRDFKSSETVANIGDQIEWLGEDYHNHGKISKSEYEAKLKILRMKEKAAIKAHKSR
jgi:plastocyanin